MKHNYFKHLFTALLLLCATIASAHNFEVNGIYYNILLENDKTVEVTCEGTSPYEYDNEYTGNVVIPESVNYNGKTYSVTSIGQYAFYCSTKLTSITIPNSVTSIGESAFEECTGLTSIEIPNSVTSIGKYAFYFCDRLTSVVIGNSVTSIGSYAFYNCSGLTSIVIPNSVTSIGNDAFDDTAWYNSQPDGVVYAGKVLYKYKGTMPSNTSITIKDGTLGIAGGAFRNCTGLTSITIPNSVTSIENSAFRNCTGLTSVTSLIPADELFAIDSNLFHDVNKTTCTLYVPYGAKETYAATEGWKAFANIVEMEPEFALGDINNDGEVNVGDFAALVNIIFNSESIDDAIKSISDINADGEVNVGDFAALVNLIFNSGSQASPQSRSSK